MLWGFIREAKPAFAALLTLGLAKGVLNAALFWFVGGFVDLLSRGDATAFFGRYGIVVAAVGFILLVIRPVLITLESLVGQQIIRGKFPSFVRWQSHRRIMAQSLEFFQKEFAGAITSKVWQSGQAGSDVVSTSLQLIWANIAYAGCTVTVLATLDLRLSAILVLWILLYSLTAYKFVPETRRRARASAEDQNTASGHLVDVYSHIKTLFLFSSNASEDAYLMASFRRAADTLSRFYRTTTEVKAIMVVLSSIATTCIAVMTFFLWRRRLITVGDVALILGLVLRLDNQLESLMNLFSSVYRSLGSFQSCMGIVARPTLLTDKEGATDFCFKGGRISFEEVTFGYGKAAKVFEALSLSIEPGEKIGLIGKSGAGKSTFLNLLLRFYDVEGGRILVDGQDVRDVTQVSLRNKFGLVTQESSLLHRSVYENIRYGRSGASEADVWEAARQAYALEFIETLQDSMGRRGFDAYVGEGGIQLSGGQRQRIAIARVFLKNAPILLLDEATSALDSKLDSDVQHSLFAAMSGKTVLAVAHRLSTLANMDRLLVIEGGRIAEQGSHRDLMARGGLYYELWQKQFNGLVAGDAPQGADTALVELGRSIHTGSGMVL
jgi:ATP-binding cassette subfamily B multidrug efflux pump